MNDLEALRDQAIGMRAQLNGFIKAIERLMRDMAEVEEEETVVPTFGRRKEAS